MSIRKRDLTPSERLVIALDFDPTTREDRADNAMKQAVAFAKKLKGTGITLKVNSLLRANGTHLLQVLRDLGFGVFADLKLYDIDSTLATDGKFLREFDPELLTVVCTAGAEAMEKAQAELPATEIIGITVLTSHTEQVCQRLYGCSIAQAAERFSKEAALADIGGLVSAATDIGNLREKFGDRFSYNAPAIRPEWSIVRDDNQATGRKMGPQQAIAAGASRIIVGRPILQHGDPLGAVERTLEEIHMGLPG